MKHNIRIYDTGKLNSYDRRNEPMIWGSGIAGIVLLVVGFCMIMGGIFDPMAPAAVWQVGMTMVSIALAQAMAIATHRNFGLSVRGREVMDAIYSLPKNDRKRFKISVDEIEALDRHDADDLIREIRDYKRNRAGTTGLGLMLGEISEYNKTVREIEGDKVSPGVRGAIDYNRRTRGY